jgi:hypothetical protein
VTDHDEPDPDLLARLRAADPASSLPPADPDRVALLLEAAMSDTATRSHESRETGTHDRSPLTWLVAAAAVVLIAAAGVLGLVDRGHDASPTAQGTVTELGFEPAPGRCMLPSVPVLEQQSLAFRGTLVSLSDGTAAFDVSRWFVGGPTDVVRVTAPAPRIAALVQGAHLTIGQDYLVSATGGNVTSCGFTGPATGHLRRLYDEAFGG